MNKILYLLSFLLILSCGGSEESVDNNELEEQDAVDLMSTEETSSSEVLFEGVFNQSGYLESRSEMIEILGRIGVHDYMGESFRFVHSGKTSSGFEQVCDYDFNGTLDFLFSGTDTLTEFYDSYEPVFEHNSQDLFPYLVEDIFVKPAEKELSIKVRSLENVNGVFGTDMAIPYMTLTISENPDFGPIMEFGGKFYLREDFYNSLPAKECEPYEP